MISHLTSKIQQRQHLLAPAALMIIVLAGAFFRFLELGKQPLWMDEAFSVWMSQHSLPDIIKLTIQIDQHPPLYHILLHLWSAMGGTSEFWTRSFSALLGVLTIPAIYYLGKGFSGVGVGLLSALLLAFSPLQVEFSQEARSYMLLTLSACLSMGMVLRLMTVSYRPGLNLGDQFIGFLPWRKNRPKPFRQETLDPSTRKNHAVTEGITPAFTQFLNGIQVDLTWFGYMFFTALAVYTHNTAVFLPLGINLFVFGMILYRRFFPAKEEGQLRAPSIKNWLVAQLGICFFWLPWLPSFYLQTVGVVDNFWIQPPNFNLVINTLKNFVLAWVPARLSFSGLIWLGFAGFLVLAAIKQRRNLSRFSFLAILFLTPFLGELLASLYRPIFYDRTLIWCAIPLYVLLADGVSHLRYRSYIITALVILVTLNLLALNNYFTYFEKERWDLTALYVGKSVQTDDIIIFNANWAEIPFDYYFSAQNKKVIEFGAPETMFEYGVLEPRMTSADLPRLRTILRGRNRVWLVYSHNWWTDPQSLIQKELNTQMRLMDVQMFNGMQIQLYRRP